MTFTDDAEAPEMCRCGCGRPEIASRADDAALLAAARTAAGELKQKLVSGGQRRLEAERLLKVWNTRILPPLDDYVHGRPLGFLGKPMPGYVALWRDRAQAL